LKPSNFEGFEINLVSFEFWFRFKSSLNRARPALCHLGSRVSAPPPPCLSPVHSLPHPTADTGSCLAPVPCVRHPGSFAHVTHARRPPLFGRQRCCPRPTARGRCQLPRTTPLHRSAMASKKPPVPSSLSSLSWNPPHRKPPRRPLTPIGCLRPLSFSLVSTVAAAPLCPFL
jgi:hypothetical protein